jgi:hypothetical protein
MGSEAAEETEAKETQKSLVLVFRIFSRFSEGAVSSNIANQTFWVT